MEGDKLHQTILQDNGRLQDKTDLTVDIDEFPNELNINFDFKSLQASVSVLNTIVFGYAFEIGQVLRTAMDKEMKPLMLRIHDKWKVVFTFIDKTFAVFDPHSCDKNGQTDGNGLACLLHYSHFEELLAYLTPLAIVHPNEQIDCAVCDVELLCVGNNNRSVEKLNEVENMNSGTDAGNIF